MTSKYEKYAQKLSFFRRERSLPAVLGEKLLKASIEQKKSPKQKQIQMKGLQFRSRLHSEYEFKDRMKSSIGLPQSTIQLEIKKTNPQIQSIKQNSSQKFAMICGEFSKFGPARSLGAITAKTLYRNVQACQSINIKSNQQSDKRSMRKSQVHKNVQNALSQCKKISKKFKTYQQLEQVQDEKIAEVNQFIYNLSVINTIKITSPTKQINTFLNQSIDAYSKIKIVSNK